MDRAGARPDRHPARGFDLSGGDGSGPGVSVIVNTVDRAEWLAQTLEAITRLRYPTYEVVVVPGPCTDSTAEVLERYADRIRVAPWPERNLAAARNRGVAAAAGEILAFIDDDALPEPDWLDRLVEGFADPAVGVVGGFIRKPDGRGWEDRIRIANRLGGLQRRGSWPRRLKAGEYVSPTGANVAYRRAAVEAVGGFDPEFAYFFEETDLHLRLADAGWRGAVAPEAEVHHYRAESSTRDARSRPRSEYRIARSKAYFVWKHARTTHSRLQMEASIQSFAAGRGAWILGLCAQGALSVQDARKLIGELGRGVADGKTAALAKVESRAQPIHVVPDRCDRPLPRKNRLPGRSMRLCWIVGAQAAGATAEDERKLVRDLVGAGHEVTIIEPAQGAREVIRADGMWRHRIGAAQSRRGRPIRRYETEVCRELERIKARRGFDAAVAPDGLPRLRAALDRLGVKLHPSPRSQADLEALRREILAAGRASASPAVAALNRP